VDNLTTWRLTPAATPSEYTVSVQTMLLRLRSLGLWTLELSMWHRMGNGTFALDRLYGGRQVDWEWADEEVLELAWRRKGSTRGHAFVQYEDSCGIKRFHCCPAIS
jgi:hypothetical protein